MIIHIIIPVHNRIKYTIEIINCLRQQTIKNKLKIIVVDDGSTDGTDIWLRKQTDIETLKGNGNLLWAGAVNLAIKNLIMKSNKTDWLLLINNDVRIKNDYVETLYKIAKNNFPSAVGSIVKNNNEELISVGAKIYPDTFKVEEINSKKFILKNLVILKNVNVLSGRGVLYPLKSIIEVNGLRPRIIPHYFADYDLSLRVNKKGYKLLISMKASVYTDEDFKKLQEKRKQEKLIFKLFARKSYSLWYSKFLFWWEASNNIQRISLPYRIIKFIILPDLRISL